MSIQLEADVWTVDNCAGCGLCVAACSKQVLAWNGDQHPIREERIKHLGYTKVVLDSCTFCEQVCAEVCPRLVEWIPQPAQVTLRARAVGPMASGQPNAIVRSLIAAGLSAGLLDGAIILDIDPWSLQPVARIVTSVPEVAATVGLQYLWAPLLEALNEAIFVRGLRDLAIAATPCAAQAVRRLQESNSARLRPYQEAIKLTIALFCTGIYQEELVEELLVTQSGIPKAHVRRLEMSAGDGALEVTLWDGEVRKIPSPLVSGYMRSGCGSCTDYCGESADLAVGTSGSDQDLSTLIIRTRTGDIFARNAQRMRLLETSEMGSDPSLAAAVTEKRRRQRAQAYHAVRILSLDALADPAGRNEAIEKFSRLYRMPRSPRAGQVVLDGCTGC